MTQLSATAKKLILGVALQFCLLLALGLAVILLLYPFEKPLAFLGGLLLGSAWSAAKVVMMERGLSQMIDLDQDGAQARARWQFIIRYAITAALLIFAALTPWISFWGMTAGLLILQTAAYVVQYGVRKE
ncbi:MAG: ATP synthase subunit I [Clostridiales bacterium]|jgi:hypothetical protein|nr:ATP synthase subunit I [Clostridiales bacterium]